MSDDANTTDSQPQPAPLPTPEPPAEPANRIVKGDVDDIGNKAVAFPIPERGE
jgi:hypothetical protein